MAVFAPPSLCADIPFTWLVTTSTLELASNIPSSSASYTEDFTLAPLTHTVLFTPVPTNGMTTADFLYECPFVMDFIVPVEASGKITADNTARTLQISATEGEAFTFTVGMTFTIDDGFENKAYNFVYNTALAACDDLTIQAQDDIYLTYDMLSGNQID